MALFTYIQNSKYSFKLGKKGDRIIITKKKPP